MKCDTGDFMKIRRDDPNMLKIAQKYRVLEELSEFYCCWRL